MKNTTHQPAVWVYLCAMLLSFNGGYISAGTLVSFFHNAVGYVTGNMALSGTYIAYHEYRVFVETIALVLVFLLGAFVSGLMIENTNYHKDYRYGFNLLIQFLLVLIAMLGIAFNLHWSEYLLAMALGLQNAMTTHYGSALIRTTHMTGTTTDLGVLLAYWLKGKEVATWKMKLYGVLIVFFLLGAIAGAVIFQHIGATSLIVSLVIYVVMMLLNRLGG